MAVPPKRTPSPKLVTPRHFVRADVGKRKKHPKVPPLSVGFGGFGGLGAPFPAANDSLAKAFQDGNLVGSENEITDSDGTSFSSGGNEIGGGGGGDVLAGNKLRALGELNKPTRRLGRKRSEKGPGRSRVY